MDRETMARHRETTHSGRDEGQTPSESDGIPPIRLAVGLADAERERALLPALMERGDFAVVDRCLAADQLLECVRDGRVEAVLVASDLHRLTSTTLAELARTRVPLVVLASHSDDGRLQATRCPVLPLEADPEAVRAALWVALRGEHPGPLAVTAEPESELEAPVRPNADRDLSVSVIAVASGHGSPGRTTVALSLAAALGAVAPTVLVDADLSGPSLAACLDADPTRNLYMLAHAEPGTSRDWERAIGQETQPLGPRSPHGAVLCGVPKPEMRAGLSPRFFERLVAKLRQRYRYVVLDIGAELLGAEAAVHRAALGLSQQVLLVASADLVGLWHARTALGVLKNQLQIAAERTALIVNCHDRRYHHDRAEIEWALGVPTAAVIPHDHRAVQRALMAQRPLVLDRRSRAARALLDLAERVHGGSIALPPEPGTNGRARWRNWVPAVRIPWPRPGGAARSLEKGELDGDYVAPAR